MMPVLSGEDVIAELRKRDNDVPLAILSATRDVGEVARRWGVKEYLAKPVTFERLMTTLSRLLPEEPA
jgi:DNA-binding response OmpR family regulator